MKKVLLSILVATGLATTVAHAQVRLGVKGGVSLTKYADLSDVESSGHENLVNGTAGVMLNAPITDDGFFSIQPELLYSGKGDKFSAAGSENTNRMHYVDLPILAKINADGFVFEAGPQLGYLVARSYEATGNGPTVKSTSLDAYNRFDAGYVVGVGYELESGLALGLRYNGGLTDVLKEVGGVQPNGKNSAFQFQVGYFFGAK